MDDQIIAIFPLGQRAQPGFERPHSRDWSQYGIVTQRHQARNAHEGLAAYRAVPVELPYRLHVPDICETLLRQVPWTAFGGGHRCGSAALGSTPARVTS